jgi:hypothetical protein
LRRVGRWLRCCSSGQPRFAKRRRSRSQVANGGTRGRLHCRVYSRLGRRRYVTVLVPPRASSRPFRRASPRTRDNARRNTRSGSPAERAHAGRLQARGHELVHEVSAWPGEVSSSASLRTRLESTGGDPSVLFARAHSRRRSCRWAPGPRGRLSKRPRNR